MSNIKPIPTWYKGYQFRSRLEARWAKFFDLIGLEWNYEVEPLSVSGEAYLPDFVLHYKGRQIIHEVKPSHLRDVIQPIRVYVAGKMAPDYDWRGSLWPDAKGFERHESVWYTENGWVKNASISHRCGVPFSYVGPFPVCGSHGSSPDPMAIHLSGADCGHVHAEEIFSLCHYSVEMCDLFCAHISTRDAYGTLVELGMAKAFGKKISLTIDKKLVEKMQRYNEYQEHLSPPGGYDMWFAEMASDQTEYVDSFEEAQKFHASIIHSMTTKEYRRFAIIGAETNAAVMTFGDPVDVAEGMRGHCFGFDILEHFCKKNVLAAGEARAHRFDGR